MHWFAELNQLRDELAVDAAIVSAANHANREIGLRTIKLGLHALLEILSFKIKSS